MARPIPQPPFFSIKYMSKGICEMNRDLPSLGKTPKIGQGIAMPAPHEQPWRGGRGCERHGSFRGSAEGWKEMTFSISRCFTQMRAEKLIMSTLV